MGRLLWRDGFDCNAHVVVKMVSSMSENGFNYVSCQATHELSGATVVVAESKYRSLRAARCRAER
jgi:hypothetical protein